MELHLIDIHKKDFYNHHCVEVNLLNKTCHFYSAKHSLEIINYMNVWVVAKNMFYEVTVKCF